MEKKQKKIVIATGIYPPEVGGPSYYAVMLERGFVEAGDTPVVVTYGALKKLPTGIRHIAYFLRLIPAVMRADYVLALDTFSAALPAARVAQMFKKKFIVRVGGDFLWESYVERTKEPVLLSEFYKKDRVFTNKEQFLFKSAKYIFDHAEKIIFSTSWQREILIKPFSINPNKTVIIENVFNASHVRSIVPKDRIILSPSRNIFLKNKQTLVDACELLKKRHADFTLDTKVSSQAELMKRIDSCYCLVVPSLSEVSPNIVLDALSRGVPAVVTGDCGLASRFVDLVVWIDPLNAQTIADGISKLFDSATYQEYMSRIAAFSYSHSEQDIIKEFDAVFTTLQ